MDPITILQNRIEQLEAKLGLASSLHSEGQQGDSAVTNMLNASAAMTAAAAAHEKLPEAMQKATELNNYTDPNFAQNIQDNEMHMQEIAAAEPVIKHHCHCMQKCKQAAPVLESEAIAQVPQMQASVDKMQAAAMEAKSAADQVSQGVQELAETCGAAAASASEQLAAVAQKVEQAEQKMFPTRRNGLD